tara:strand:- start:353 stop:991 length:639 start_codon:yes stop_codon:yes gene_type:complete
METKYIRQTAVKVLIKELNDGSYQQQNEQEPNFLLTKTGKKIYRVNLIGIIVQTEKVGSITNFVVDDSTGTMIMRSFENENFIDKVNVGDHVLLIGKVRIYNNEIYINPEICKKVNTLWLQHRIKTINYEIYEDVNIVEEIQKEVPEEVGVEDSLLPVQKLVKLIKEMDTGDGVLIEDILEKSLINDSEKIIERMLESGDIFQNMPGKVKVL